MCQLLIWALNEGMFCILAETWSKLIPHLVQSILPLLYTYMTSESKRISHWCGFLSVSAYSYTPKPIKCKLILILTVNCLQYLKQRLLHRKTQVCSQILNEQNTVKKLKPAYRFICCTCYEISYSTFNVIISRSVTITMAFYATENNWNIMAW